jgi:hypothetical protein
LIASVISKEDFGAAIQDRGTIRRVAGVNPGEKPIIASFRLGARELLISLILRNAV